MRTRATVRKGKQSIAHICTLIAKLPMKQVAKKEMLSDIALNRNFSSPRNPSYQFAGSRLYEINCKSDKQGSHLQHRQLQDQVSLYFHSFDLESLLLLRVPHQDAKGDIVDQ